MPDSVILKIETMGNQHLPGVFDFSDRNGVLFEWNDDVDKYNEILLRKTSYYTHRWQQSSRASLWNAMLRCHPLKMIFFPTA